MKNQKRKVGQKFTPASAGVFFATYLLFLNMFITSTEQITAAPKRIISLVPSISSLLYHFELELETIAITKFCTLPEHWNKTKILIGGTKNIKTDLIAKLNPDLIIANKEENIKEQIEELAGQFPVWLTDVNNLEDNLAMIDMLGKITGKEKLSNKLLLNISNAFDEFNRSKNAKYSTCYLIWKDPFMSVGSDTFIHEMMDKAGFDNIFREQKRYPTVTIADIIAKKPELILLSSEPYPFKEKHLEMLRSYFPNTILLLTDGIYFSWYGDQIQHSPSYFKELHEIIIRESSFFHK